MFRERRLGRPRLSGWLGGNIRVLAMQKVVGSSRIIRFRNPLKEAGFCTARAPHRAEKRPGRHPVSVLRYDDAPKDQRAVCSALF
jgi:hypothetical protein